MTSQEILKQLKTLGKESTANILMKHGAKAPCYGVKIEDSKKLIKTVKGNLTVAKELFNSGVYDAMYLAGLVADGSSMSKKELDDWAKANYGGGISEYTVPWVACESQFGFELALEWITSKSEFVAVSGWATLANLVSVKEDPELDLKKIKALVDQVEKEIHTAPNRVRYVMNGFVIAVGSYVTSLSDHALKVAAKIGAVKVNVGDTLCKVPLATEYINKVKLHGSIGKKKKNIKC
ncbi:MAG: alkylation repair protein [Bacteroidota bacterium]|nr:alkylation repair protein [Bacteroidota bacterium]